MAGRTRYHGALCSKGHGTERLVATGGCAECARQLRRSRYDEKQRVSARTAAQTRRASDPVAERQRSVRVNLKAVYGLTEKQYADMFEAQRGYCAICPSPIVSRLDPARPLYIGRGAPAANIARVDHCHETNAVRGLLCSDCNLGLGKFKDSIPNLLNAVRYLRASATALARPVAERESVSEIEPSNRDLDSSRRRGSRRDELNQFLD